MITLKVGKNSFIPLEKICMVLSTSEPGATKILDFFSKHHPEKIINVCAPKPSKDGKGRGLMPRSSLILLENNVLVISSVSIGWLLRSLNSLNEKEPKKAEA